MFYPSYTAIINGKVKLLKYQFDVGNLSFMDFPAFTEPLHSVKAVKAVKADLVAGRAQF